MSDLRPGDPEKIAAYRIVSRLGVGGQGVVYLAAGPAGERVAIKQLRSDPEDGRAKQQLAKEVAAARRVAPFCTARVLDAQLDGPSPYVISEYIEGPSLQQYVQRHGPMRGLELERLAMGTATALAAIHQAGVVHRDFKPANVMLAKDGPRVIDFGIARDLSTETTITSRIFGTPAYMAPEQLRAERVGPATDMFAWASVIAYAATGRAPFEAPHMMAVAHRISAESPDLTGVPPELIGVLQRCLAKDPAQRPTAQQALALLLGRPAPAHDMADATQVLAEATGLVQAAQVTPPTVPYRASSTYPAPVAPGAGRYTPESAPPVAGGWGSPPHGQPANGRPGPGQPGPPRRNRAFAIIGVLLVCALVAWLIAQHRSQQQDASSNTPTVTATSTHHAGGGRQQTSAPTTVASTATSSSSQPTTSAPATVASTTDDDDSDGTTVPESFDGDWRGAVIQANGQVKFWTARISLKQGDDSGTFTAEELGCSGPASVESATDTTLILDATINDDPNQACAPRGTIQLTLLARKRATLKWQDASDSSNTAQGILKRS